MVGSKWKFTFLDGASISHDGCTTVNDVLDGRRLRYQPIFSAGIMQQWMENGWASKKGELDENSRWWHLFAPLLEDSWNFWSNRADILDQGYSIGEDMIFSRVQESSKKLFAYLAANNVIPPMLKPYHLMPSSIARGMIKSCIAAKAISYHQTLEVALDYLLQNEGLAILECMAQIKVGFKETQKGGEEIINIEVRNIAAGHTATILRVGVYHKNSNTPDYFCLNVARDATTAANELSANFRDLNNWALSDSTDEVNEVYDKGIGNCRWFGQNLPIPVLCSRWYTDTHELHAAKESTSNLARFVIVESFQDKSQPLPEIRGRAVEKDLSDLIWMRIVEKRTQLASINWKSKILDTPEVEVNHGDIAIKNEAKKDGIKLVFVGSSNSSWKGRLEAWLYEMALSSARDDMSANYQRIYWGNPLLAIESVYRGLLSNRANSKLQSAAHVIKIFESAGKLEIDDLVHSNSFDSNSTFCLELVQQTKLAIAQFLKRFESRERTKKAA